MNRRIFLQVSSLAALAPARPGWAAALRRDAEPAPQDVGPLLETIRQERQFPGVAAAVVRGQQIVAQGVAGVRQMGKPDKIALEDRFALGSCGKRMTLLMLCRLVDAGQLTFESTLAQVLPQLPMRDVYRNVTLAQLLTFKGGIQPYTRIGPRMTPILFEAGPLAERRVRFVKHLLQEEPIVPPGTAMRYSNASYILAGFVASQVAQQEFEPLMREQVFKPLALTHAGFGRPRTAERPDQPWLHVKGPQGYAPEPDIERPAEGLMAPAGGGVHCAIRDFARFAAHELATGQGKSPLLKPQTVQHAKEVLGQEWSGAGANMGGAPWLAAGCLILPQKDCAIVTAINAGTGDGACEAVFQALRSHFKV